MAELSPPSSLQQIMGTLDRFATRPHAPTDADEGARAAAPAPSRGVAVGMILHTAWGQSWSPDLADRNREILTRAIAMLVYDTITDPTVYPGAAQFLATSASPDHWESPADVDAWLSALQGAGEAHQHDVAPVTRLLDERANELDPGHAAPKPSISPTRAPVGR